MSTSKYIINFLRTRHGRVISEGAGTGEEKVLIDFLNFLAVVVGVMGKAFRFLFERRSMWTWFVSSVGCESVPSSISEFLFKGIITISEREKDNYI